MNTPPRVKALPVVPKRPEAKPPPPEQRPKKSGQGLLWGLILAGVLAVVVVIVIIHKHEQQVALDSTTKKMAVPTVLVMHPQRGSPDTDLTLPGTVEALMESSVYAQVSGYIKRWLVDIGAPVTQGELLAEIETPVTDQQLRQAEENVGQAQANLNLARTTAARYNSLLATHAVSQQDVDNQNANVQVQLANLAAAQAFVAGIQQTEAFKEVKAPFDGVVTARRIDVGDYVSATGQTNSANSSTGNPGSAPVQTGTPSQELFRVAQTKVLRVYVEVPEHYASETLPGITATLNLASSPNETVTGKLVRTADAIDPSSLTLLAEVDVDNPDGKLLPGGYAQVHFKLVDEAPPLVILGNTLIFRSQGTQVGVVDDSNTVHLKDIKIGRDLGTKLEIIDGLEESDRVIVNPSDSITDGMKVQVDDSSAPKIQ